MATLHASSACSEASSWTSCTHQDRLDELRARHRPTPLPLRRELAHVLRRSQGLLGAEDLVFLARAEGLTDDQIRSLIQSWEGRRWPLR
jgi:hypothetical protein